MSNVANASWYLFERHYYYNLWRTVWFFKPIYHSRSILFIWFPLFYVPPNWASTHGNKRRVSELLESPCSGRRLRAPLRFVIAILVHSYTRRWAFPAKAHPVTDMYMRPVLMTSRKGVRSARSPAHDRPLFPDRCVSPYFWFMPACRASPIGGVLIMGPSLFPASSARQHPVLVWYSYVLVRLISYSLFLLSIFVQAVVARFTGLNPCGLSFSFCWVALP